MFEELPIPPGVGTGHMVYDTAMGITLGVIVAVMVGSKAIEVLRDWGFLPEKVAKEKVSNGDAVKNVGMLGLESFKSVVRHEIRNELTPVSLKIDQLEDRFESASKDQLKVLNDINVGIAKVAAILTDRGR